MSKANTVGSTAPSAPHSRDDRGAPYLEPQERVEIVRHARDAGRENLPRTSASEPNDVESAIVREHRNRHRAAVEAARGDLRGIAEEWAKIEDQLPRPHQMQAIPIEAAAAVERELATDQSIEPARRELQLRHRDLRRFQREHGLGREARYPASRLMHVAWVAVIVVFESVMNAGFFSAGSEIGLFGGFLIAAGISLVNVGSGVVAGYFPFRYLHARRRAIRVAATAGVFVYTLGAVTFNLALAHVRDQISAVHGLIGLSVGSAMQHPFALSIPSIALLILGLVASVLAVWDGYTLDDAYPDYGEVDRQRSRAARAFREADEHLRARVLGHVEAVPRRCLTVLDQVRGQVSKLRDLAVQAERRIERYETERAHAEHWCVVLLRRYRSENEAVRTTPTPAYFTDYPTFPSEVDAEFVRRLNERLRLIRETLDDLAVDAHAIALEQPGRMAAIRDRLDQSVLRAVERADVGRGDGSELHELRALSDDGRWAS